MAHRVADIRDVAASGVAGVRVRDARFGELWALSLLQRRCFPASQAYGPVTLAVLHVWPRARILVATVDGRLAGCVAADVNRDGTRILNLCVAPAYRRRGIGAALLAAAEEAVGEERVTLIVEDKNSAAQALYRRAGYLPVGDLRHYYGRNRHGILMQKRRA